MNFSPHKLKIYSKIVLRNYLPKWTIFIFDSAIVAICFITLWFFRETFSAVHVPHFLLKIILIIGIYSFYSMAFHTHHGVLRFSTWNDFYKLTVANILATVTFTLFGIILNHSSFSDKPLLFSIWFGPLVGLMILSGQILLRITAKSAFEILEMTVDKNKKNVFILGSEYDSVLLAQSVRDDKTTPYNPVAFIALKEGHCGKSLGGIPILSAKSGMRGLMEKYSTKTMLLYKSQIDLMPREFYDNCIVEGLDLLTVAMYSKLGEKEEQSAPLINKIKIEDLLGRNSIEMDKEKISPLFEGKNILITGAAGSIGSEICTQLTKFKCKKLILFDQAETPLNDLFLNLSPLKGDIELKPVIGSVSNIAKMRQVFELGRPDIVFHAAAYKHVPMMEAHPSAAVITNVLGTKVVADLSVEFNVERFVMISTDKAVNPTNVMGATKRAAEIYIQSLHHKLLDEKPDSRTQFVTTRFGNVLGSNGSVVPLFKRQIEAGGPVTVTHKEITRYFMTIPEACSLVLEAGCMGHGGEILIFDMGDAVKIYDLAEKMIRLSGKIPGRDIKIVETGLRPGEKLYEELLASTENTLPTYNRKVRIAKVRRYKFAYIKPKIDKLITTAAEWIQPLEVVTLLKCLIPEFHSENSPVYEKIECELNHTEPITDEQKYIDK